MWGEAEKIGGGADGGCPSALPSGSRIAIVGAGPAGSFFALHAFEIARRQGKKIEICLLDGKAFMSTGPKGCNMCAGVIGDGLVKKLNNMGIPLTPQVIRQEIRGYSIHARGSEARLLSGPGTEIYTVFRGGGPPSLQAFTLNVSFDQFLLDCAKEQGAQYIPVNVSELYVPDGGEERPRLVLSDGATLEADLIVGAFGVNSPLLQRVPPKYRPPSTWHTCQAEVRWNSGEVEAALHGMVHIFPINAGGVEFIAVTPKREHVTLTAIGKHVRWRDLVKAANASEVKDFLPLHWTMACHCHPQVPVSPARHPYWDRLVIIGDAGYSRYLKNGIESAYYTAGFAARTALHHGIGRAHFGTNYDRWCRNMFGMDNAWGRLMFFIHNSMMANERLAATEQGQLLQEQANGRGREKKLSNIIWHLFAGDLPYRKIMLSTLDAQLQLRMLKRLVRAVKKEAKDLVPVREERVKEPVGTH